MIEITHRWGLAKMGTWGDGREVPGILSREDEVPLTVPTSHFKGEYDLPSSFGYPEYVGGALVEQRGGLDGVQVIFDQEPDPGAEVYILGNAPELVGRGDLLVKKVLSLREKIGPHKVIYAPGVASPQNLALLVYMGLDLFDTHYCEYMASRGVELSDWMGFPGEHQGNTERLRAELGLVKKGIEYGRIRELVESRVRSEPWMVETLRAMDGSYSVVSPGVPVTGHKVFACTRESLYRPDILRFRRRMLERYEPPDRDVLLLLPCSASKPYFNSRTHRTIRTITGESNWTRIQELILTSPMGAVPRELELFYPAANYDIPVSHEWYGSERDIILSLLDHVVSLGGYRHVISHLPPDMDFVREHINCTDTSLADHPTSGPALARLREELISTLGKPTGNVGKFLKENLSSMARFQFGPGGEKLLEDAVVRGRYPEYRILHANVQRGMVVANRGLISLTMQGGEVLNKEGLHLVEIDDFTPRGSVFAIGVKSADPGIHPGDECAMVCRGELRAVGRAVMSGPEMEAADRGKAVDTRHHA